jgi:hypothetical protein
MSGMAMLKQEERAYVPFVLTFKKSPSSIFKNRLSSYKMELALAVLVAS